VSPEVSKKLKELNGALDVLESVEDKVSWACEFTSFRDISQALEPIYSEVDTARDTIKHEIDYLEEQISEYEYKKAEFEAENEIKV
jgi:hypothetical protein